MTMTAAFPTAAYNLRPSRASGPDATAVEDRVAEVGFDLAATETFGRLLLRLAIDLDRLKVDDAPGVTAHPRSMQSAERFLLRMPHDLIPPEIDVDDDGEVAFEWIIDAGRRLSITFSAAGLINYSGLLDDGEAFGAERFDDEIPESILRSLRRILP